MICCFYERQSKGRGKKARGRVRASPVGAGPQTLGHRPQGAVAEVEWLRCRLMPEWDASIAGGGSILQATLLAPVVFLEFHCNLLCL